MAELEIQKQVDDVQALIDAIPVTADELTAENYATYKQVIVDAQTAYSALGDLAAGWMRPKPPSWRLCPRS